MSFIKKENICISQDYTDGQGQQKKLWKPIGEIVTLSGSNGPFQKVNLWGPGGFIEASVLEPRVLEPRDNNQQQAPQNQQQGAPQQQPQQNYQQQGYQNPPGYQGR